MDAEQVEYVRRVNASFKPKQWQFIYVDAAGNTRAHRCTQFRQALRLFRQPPGYMRALCIARNGVIMVTRKGGAS